MAEEERDGVRLTSLDQPLGDGLEVTKGDLVDYLDAVADRLVPLLAGRPLSVKRVRPGAGAVHAAQRDRRARRTGCAPWRSGRRARTARCTRCSATTGARCCGWPTSGRSSSTCPFFRVGDDRADRPGARPRPARGRGLRRRRAARPGWSGGRSTDAGLAGAVKTSGVEGGARRRPGARMRRSRTSRPPPGRWPPAPSASTPSSPPPPTSRRTGGGRVFVDSTRSGQGTIVAAYSPRIRPGLPVSAPVGLGRAGRRAARATSR